MVNSNAEIVHDGWLLKSPPPKRLWRAKWRNRWFVLRSGELPGQYFLEYYTDDSRKKLKGKIDLDQCEQVDAGITFAERKFDYKFMFDIKTPKRIYYLCAETEELMNRWVDCVCQVCGLKVMAQDDFYNPLVQLNPLTGPTTSQTATPPLNFDPHRLIEYPAIDSPPPSASSIVSGPYIPISECITGKKNSVGSTRFPFGQETNSMTNENLRFNVPNEMAPPAPPTCPTSYNQSGSKCCKPRESYDVPRQLRPSATTSEDTSSIQSPISTESSTLFSDDERVHTPSLREDKNFNEEISVSRRNSQSRSSKPTYSEGESPPPYQAPPRPPKPPYLAEVPQQNYMNLDTIIRASNVRRNSSSEKSKSNSSVVTSHLAVPESSVSSSDPEPSPVSISSNSVPPNSVPPNTPKEITDDMYDFPRSHHAELVAASSVLERNRRHCYNNCAPNKVQGKVFSYDTQRDFFDKNVGETDPRISPLGAYANFSTPPAVDRGSKPKKTNESNSTSASELSPPPSGGAFNDIPSSLGAVGGLPITPASAPPIVDRNRKPPKKISEPTVGLNNTDFVLDPAPRSRLRTATTEIKMPRAAPSPTPPSLRNGRGNDSDTDVESISSPSSRRDSTADEQIFFPLPTVQRRSSNEIQYLDLDLETQAQQPQCSPKVSKSISSNKFASCDSSVVYKKVDFVKTEAFNKMRQNVEEGYRKYQE